MSKIILLTKNYFRVFIGSIKWRKRKGKYVAASGILLLGMIGAVAAISFQAYATTIAFHDPMISPDPTGSLSYGAFMALAITLLATVMRSLTPAKMNDTELLLSMPIRKSDIVISKSFSKYFFDFVPIALFLVPYIVCYGIVNGYAPEMALGGLLVVLLLPMLSVGLSYLLSSLLNLVGGQFRYGNMIKIVLTLIITFGFIILSSTANPATTSNFGSILPPVGWIKDIVLSLDVTSLAYLALMTIPPFILGLIFFSASFGINRAKFVSTNKNLTFKSHKVFTSLVIKESKRYFSSPIYVINTIIGPIFIIGIAIYTIFGGPMLKMILTQLNTVIPVSYVVAAALTTMIGMSSTSASSISLEGKNIWILKAHPVEPKTVFLAKAGFNVLLTAPVSLLAVIIVAFTLKLNPFDTFLILVLTAIVCIYVGLLGVILNMWFPKMDWDSDVTVVKQSIAVLLAIMGGMFFSIITFIPAFLVKIPFGWYALGLIALYGGICLLIWMFLSHRGTKLFQEL